MGWALLENTTLESLDLTCNRIHPPALFELLKGLEKNKALTTLKVSGDFVFLSFFYFVVSFITIHFTSL